MNLQLDTRNRSNIPMPWFRISDQWTLEQLRQGKVHCLERRTALEKDCAEIASQLEAAASRAEDGEMINQNWWHRASAALVHKRRELRHIKNCLEDLDRRIELATRN
jgi:DNA-binding FrmR family transcriptional regulator